MRRFNSPVYILGKFGHGYRETVDTDTGTLYSHGQYKTKITVSELPDYYIKCHSRVFWYMYGYVKTAGVKYVAYTYHKENHVFKDDYLYISYDKPLEPVYSTWGNPRFILDYSNGIRICGNDIIRLILAIEKYSPDVDTSEARRLIDEKIEYLMKCETDYYYSCFHTTEKIDIFERYKDNFY